jgi:drug/metabolite transporter (DMT)-like permease
MSQETQPVPPAPASPAPQSSRRLSLPVQIGLAFGVLGLLLTVIGIARGQVPLAPANIAVALLLGGGVWFVIAWAVATAAVDVERDLE